MIIKCVSRKSNVGQLIKYVLAQHKTMPEKVAHPISWRYASLHNFTAKELEQLAAERTDAVLTELRAEYKDLSLTEFIERYVIQGKENVNVQFGGKPIIVTHGLRTKTIEGYIKEFEENEKQRKYSRKDNVRAYHHIISFSQVDTKFITEKTLRDMAQRYISLRGPDCLFLAVAHIQHRQRASAFGTERNEKLEPALPLEFPSRSFRRLKGHYRNIKRTNTRSLRACRNTENLKVKNQRTWTLRKIYRPNAL